MENDGTGIEVQRNFFGTLQVRITIWYKTEGDGIVTTVYDALKNNYKGKRISPAIKSALNYIQYH